MNHARLALPLLLAAACAPPVGDATTSTTSAPTTSDAPAASTGDGEAGSADAEVPAPGAVATWFLTRLDVELDDIVWGDLHTHSYYSQDAAIGALVAGNPTTATPADAYALARSRGLSFGAITDHAEAPVPDMIPADDPSANVWESGRRMARAAEDTVDDTDGIYIPFVGWEYTNPFPCVGPDCPGPRSCAVLGNNQSCEAYGHKNVVFRDIDAAPTRRASYIPPSVFTATGDACTGSDPDPYCGFDTYTDWTYTNENLWDWLEAGDYDLNDDGRPDALTVIHTPGNIHHVDWDAVDNRFVRNVEIFSQWGSSEGAPPSGCDVTEDRDVRLPPDALNADEDLIRAQIGARWIDEGDADYALSFVGGSDDHEAQPGGDGNGNGGVTGAIVSSRDRNGVFDALVDRRTLAATWYSSTGPARLLFGVETGGRALLNGDVGTLAINGSVTVRAVADPRVRQIQIVVDGCTTHTLSGHEVKVDLTLDPDTRHWIYVRARRPTGLGDRTDAGAASTDYDQTWSSPIYLR